MMRADSNRLIYISGRGGDANKGLGDYLKKIDPYRIGLSVNSSFLNKDFNEQVKVVRYLFDEFDGPNTSFVANSYGAYLVLHALIGAPKYKSDVLLLSPAIGGILNKQSRIYARQPGGRVFDEAMRAGSITKPNYLSIHIGSLDIGYDEKRFAAFTDIDLLNVIPEQGHMIERGCVVNILQSFLNRRAE